VPEKHPADWKSIRQVRSCSDSLRLSQPGQNLLLRPDSPSSSGSFAKLFQRRQLAVSARPKHHSIPSAADTKRSSKGLQIKYSLRNGVQIAPLSRNPPPAKFSDPACGVFPHPFTRKNNAPRENTSAGRAESVGRFKTRVKSPEESLPRHHSYAARSPAYLPSSCNHSPDLLTATAHGMSHSPLRRSRYWFQGHRRAYRSRCRR
jgi:hypothetical protein